jgi:quinoprotein glucose dehydrogenase
VVFGLHGGAEWPGAAVNQNTGILYVPSNQFPWTLRLHHTDGQKAPAANIPYQQKCAGCHGQERGGFYETEFTGDKTLPSLVGISANRGRYELSQFRQDHPGTPMPEPVSADDLEQIDHYLHEADSVGDQRGSLNITGIWQLLLDRDRYPGSRPPWGMITAIDLNSGKRVWQVPFGEFEELTKRGIAPTGQPNFGGLFVTGAGLVFATGTIDRKIRALDADTGTQLWEYELPAAGSAPPSTYEIDGTQYLVVVATGGIFAGFKDRSDTIMAFKLDDH